MKKFFLMMPFIPGSAAMAQEHDWGARFYAENCAGCHGETAKGDGVLADYLTVDVPDLTSLSAANDGVFPMLRVIQIIDGRSGLRTHEKPMPLYGAIFREDLQPPMGMPGASEPLVRGRVLSIAEYLQSIQE